MSHVMLKCSIICSLWNKIFYVVTTLELGRVFDQFPRYDMKILLGDFNAKVGREDIVTC
jgi:hypothetical protein